MGMYLTVAKTFHIMRMELTVHMRIAVTCNRAWFCLSICPGARFLSL